MQQNDNITISRVQTREQLDQLLDQGLAALYKDVFGGAPYFESFTTDEVKDIFREFLDKKGIVFVAADAGKPVAFVASVPLSTKFELAQIAQPYSVDASKTAYFAEDGVAAEYRRIGLSARMKKMLLDANKQAGLPYMLLRTSAKNYAQINAVNKAGGHVLRDAFQKVARKTKNGQEIDTNAFYLFGKDENTSGLSDNKLDRVIIVRTPEGRDVAFIFEPIGKALYGRGIDGIKDVYPRISRVTRGNSLDQVPDGKVLFDGPLYLTWPAIYPANDSPIPWGPR